MTSLRSSVRPESSKQPWGTILEPEFGMGYQKMTEYEVEQTVDRLSRPPPPQESVTERHQGPQIGSQGIKEMLKRLTTNSSQNVTDSERTQKASTYSQMGVVNSYAWKGYN